jgi:hypothetical protein
MLFGSEIPDLDIGDGKATENMSEKCKKQKDGNESQGIKNRKKMKEDLKVEKREIG